MSQLNNLLPLMAQFCKLSGFNRLCTPVYGGRGLILMFHRFARNPQERIDGGVLDIRFLDALLTHIRKTGPEIIPLHDVPRAIAQKRRFICLTIDDGYRDNLEVALPVLHRHTAPATIFVPSGILDRSLDAWWLQIEEKAKSAANPQLAFLNMITEASSSPEALARMRSSFTLDQAEINDRYFLSEAEVKSIANDPLIDIGGHTVTHPLLKTQTDDEAYHEIVQNKQDLEQLLQRPVETFAYPFGHERSCGAREYELVEKAGYKVAVTTRDGNILPKHANHLTALPRYSVRGQYEYLAIYDMQKSGAYRALRSRFGSAFVTE